MQVSEVARGGRAVPAPMGWRTKGPDRPSGSEEDQRAARRRPSEWTLPGLWLGVGELRNNVKLLHHSECVPVGVLLDHLAVF